MSQVKIQGNASGTGQFTIAAPNSNNNQTLTLPDNTGTILTTGTAGVPVNGPAFSAYNSNSQSFSSANTYTKVVFNTEEFDTGSCFDSTTNYRFTPTVAGYYQINAGVSSNTAATYMTCAVYKNGTIYKRGANYSTSTASPNAAVSALVYLNGSTDYVEIFAISSVTFSTFQGIDTVYFQGAMVRSAA